MTVMGGLSYDLTVFILKIVRGDSLQFDFTL